LEENSLLGGKVIPHDLPSNWPDIDIDTPEDWEMAKRFIFYKKESII
jgi:CMP-N-acetylneuraminic acid synthetase